MTEPQNPSKVGATEARTLLGFPPGSEVVDARYLLWRTEVTAYMIMNGVRHQTQAGDDRWEGVREFAIDHWVIVGYKEVLNGTGPASERVQEALQYLLFDLRAKLSVKRKNAKQENETLRLGPTNYRYRGPATSQTQSSNVSAPGALTAAPSITPMAFEPKGVIVYLTDPDAVPGSMCGAIPVLERQWGGKGVLRYVGMIYEPTMNHLISLALRKTDVDAKKVVRNLLGAMGDPILGASGVITQSPESVVLADNEDVEGWLATTKANPLRLLAILGRPAMTAGEAASQTPPPDGWAHIAQDEFGTVDEPIKTTDGEGPVTKKRRRPNTKTGYRKRLGRLRRFHERLGDHIQEIQNQFEERFPSSPDECEPNPPAPPPPSGKKPSTQTP